MTFFVLLNVPIDEGGMSPIKDLVLKTWDIFAPYLIISTFQDIVFFKQFDVYSYMHTVNIFDTNYLHSQ